MNYQNGYINTFKNILQGSLFFIVISFFVFIILTIDNLLTSFVLAVVLNFMLSPVIDLFERRGVKRFHAIMFVFIALGLCFAIALKESYPFLIKQVELLRAELPDYWGRLLTQINSWQARLAQHNIFAETQIFEVLKGFLAKPATSIIENLPSFFSKSLTTLILAPILGFFMLVDGERMAKQFYRLVPNKIFELTLVINSQIRSQIGEFIRSRLVASFFVGFIVWGGLAMQDTPLSFPMAVFAGVVNLIPYIGPFLSIAPALILGLTKSYEFVNFVLLVMPYIVAQAIDGFIILPFVVARLINLHPVTILVSLLAGAQALGVLGMLVAIPVVITCKLIVVSFYKHLFPSLRSEV